MTIPTLVLSPRYTPDSNRLWQAAVAEGWYVERLQNHRAPDHLQAEEVVLYGEALFTRIIADQLGLNLHETPHDWLTTLPFAYRQRDIRLMTLRDARQLHERAFIKPATDKSFDARVCASGADLPSADYFDDDTPTLVSDPVAWQIEYRCFVANRELETLAPYSRGGQALKDENENWLTTAPDDAGAVEFVNQLLADQVVSLPPGLVLDAGIIADRGWAVVEANPAWASGIYGNDPAKVLHVLQASVAV